MMQMENCCWRMIPVFALQHYTRIALQPIRNETLSRQIRVWGTRKSYWASMVVRSLFFWDLVDKSLLSDKPINRFLQPRVPTASSHYFVGSCCMQTTVTLFNMQTPASVKYFNIG